MKCCLLFAHAVSGCNTISATHDVGKIKAYNVLLRSEILQKSMSIVGKRDIDMEDVMKLGEMFFMQLYGKAGNHHADSLDDLRKILYMLPKYIPIQRMPPTSRTFHFFMLRVQLQRLQCSLSFEYIFKSTHGCIYNVHYASSTSSSQHMDVSTMFIMLRVHLQVNTWMYLQCSLCFEYIFKSTHGCIYNVHYASSTSSSQHMDVSTMFIMLRVHLQVNTWMYLQCSLCFEYIFKSTHGCIYNVHYASSTSSSQRMDVSTMFIMLRVHLQVNTWMYLQCSLCFEYIFKSTHGVNAWMYLQCSLCFEYIFKSTHGCIYNVHYASSMLRVHLQVNTSSTSSRHGCIYNVHYASSTSSSQHVHGCIYNVHYASSTSSSQHMDVSTMFIMLRVHLQVNAWMYLQCTSDPLKYGFKKDGNDCFKPIITDKEVAPQDLLKNLKCSCRI